MPRPSAAVATYEPRPSGAYLAQGMRQSGGEIAQAAEIIAQTNLRQDSVVSQDRLNQLQRAMVDMEYGLDNGYRNVRGSKAVDPDFLRTQEERLTVARQAMRDTLTNDSQKKLFDQHADVAAMRFRAGVLAHQSEQTNLFNNQTEQDSINNELQKMAINPSDESVYRDGIFNITKTVGSRAARLGLSEDSAKALTTHYTSAGLVTRIMSLMQGSPIKDAAPYEAEKLFKESYASLTPEARNSVAPQILRATKGLQAKETAQSIVYGTPPIRASALQQALTGPPLVGAKVPDAVIQPVIQRLETGGLPNPETAVGPMTRFGQAKGPGQVLDSTAANPGFGIRPAQKDEQGKYLPGELTRVFKEYAGAMNARYSNPALVLAAYNAGYGRLDGYTEAGKRFEGWLTSIGDPRTGAISTDEWAARIPFKETREYVQKGLRILAQQGGAPADMPVAAPSANQLRLDLTARMEYARRLAEEQYPNDPEYADMVVTRVANYGRTVIEASHARESAARDTLVQGMIGQRPDGSDAPQTIDQMLADPTMRRAWEQATPETRQGIQSHFRRGDKDWTPDAFREYYRLIGEATNNPEKFADRDLGSIFGAMPMSGVNHIVNMQAALRTREARDAAKVTSYAQAAGWVEPLLRPLQLGRGAKTTTKKEETEVFYGALREAMDDFHKNNGKRPQEADVLKLATGLLAQGKTPGSFFGSLWPSTVPAYQAAREGRMEGFQIQLPDNQAVRAEIAAQFETAHGRKLTPAELQREYTQFRLSGGRDPVPRASFANPRRASGVVTEAP